MAVTNSVIQKACHTPRASRKRLKTNATGRISRAYRSREITSEGVPMPSPSRAPQEMMETEETIKPMLMIHKAVLPMAMVSALVENKPISCPGIVQHRMVPTAMMHAERVRATR